MSPGRRNGCCCWITFGVLVIGALLVAAFLAPDTPSIPDFFIDDASVSNDSLTTTFHLQVSAYNPNALFFFHYDDVLVAVYHNTSLLANDILPGPFSHPPRARLTLRVDLVAPNGDLATVEGLGAARSAAGSTADLEVRMTAKTQYKIAGWEKSRSVLTAACSLVRVKFSSSPDAAREAHGCSVDLIS